MKRGYMDWVQEILPEATLKARRAGLANIAKEQGLKAVIVYGDVYAADELSFFCNYAPYWCNAALIVAEDSDVTLVTGHNYRVNPWISGLTGLEDSKIIPGGLRVPAKLAEVLSNIFPDGGKIGIAGKYILSDTEIELAAKNITLVNVDSAVGNIMHKSDKSYNETQKKAYDILGNAVKTGIAARDLATSTRKEVCAEIEYAARKNSAMDVFIYTADKGCGFALPDSESSAKGTWNVYVAIQYLGVWVCYAFTVGADENGAWTKLDELADGIKPGAIPELKADGCKVTVRPNGAADMVSTMDTYDGDIYEGGIVSVAVLDDATGNYFERMYEVCANGAKAL